MSAQKPGELVVCTLLKQFAILAKSKIEKALEEKQENNLVKTMRLSEDVAFEQLLDALHICAEFALPSLVQTIIQWYHSQHSSGSQYSTYLKRAQLSKDCKPVDDLMTHSCFVSGSDPDGSHSSEIHYTLHPSLPISKLNKAVKINSEGGIVLKSFCLTATEARVLAERRDLAIDVVFCQTMLSILRQLSYHPGHNDKIELILEQSFRRFKYREDIQPQNNENVNLVADLYAEIVGLLSQTRFALVRCRFMRYLNELRSKENTPNTRSSIVSLIMGMKFFRVKMHPIEDFVNCFTFLQELGQYFLEVKEPEIKHVLSDLFVEILLPVAAVARQEVNIPALKQFVESLYPASLELVNKKKHVPALFPLVTCLLCVGTKSFFLSNWTNFLNICLSQLKNRNPKIALVSLQSLSCLLWVYIVRIRGEKHTDTQSKLHHIVNSIFPKHQKFVVPKDAPMNIFVRIIQFIAHEKLEFAVKEIIIDRLGVSGLQKNLYMPERMNIGLCAFLLVAHGLQQKEGAPPMPQQSTGGCGLRQTVLKRSFHGTNLNDALGHILGIQNYLVPIRRAFEMILRQLDIQVCRTMMLSKQEISQKEFEELMTAERKPKMDLLKTCVACIPRLLPNDMTKPELLELLAKVCLHVDEDVRKMAQQAMANLIVELPAFRVKTIQVFIQFIQKYVPDTSSHQLDSCLKTLFHLLNNWNLALQKDGAVSPNITEKAVLYEAEGFALVMLCHCRTIARRLALHILRKCRSLLNQINLAKSDPLTRHNRPPHELCCIDVLDRCVPIMLQRVLPLLPPNERHGLLNVTNLDFSALADRGSPVWLGGAVPVYPCPPVVLPTHVVSPQHSCLIPVGGVSSASTAVERPQPKDACDVSKNVACTGQYGLFPEGSTLDTATRFSDEHRQSDSRRPDSQTHISSGQVATERQSQVQQPTSHHPGQYTQQAYIVQPVQDRILLGDVWGTCLSVAFSPDHLVTACPEAIKYAWSMVYQRLSALFPLVDPSAQMAENRASSLLRSSSKKPTTERDQLIPLWHNYATLGCCIAPSSTGSRVLKPQSRDYLLDFDRTQRPSPLNGTVQISNSSCSQTPGPSTESSTNTPSTTTVATSRPTQPQPASSDSKCPVPVLKETARDLVKLLVPFLRCEQQEVRDSAVGAIGRINPAAFRDALEELHPLLKESVDRKQENVRRRRRRDGLRSSLIRVLALMSQSGLFAYPESNALTAQGYLIPQLTDYLDGMRVYLDSVADQATNPACIGSNAAVSNQLSIVTSSPSVGGSSTGSLLVGTTGSATPVVTSYSATTVNTSAGLAATSYQNVISTDAYVLMEIRLNLCIFVLELVRQLPKEKRDQLLPTMMRHQLFLLISRWSGFYDNVMGVSLSETEAAYPSFFGASRQNFYRLSRSSVLNSGLSPIAANQLNANDSASLNSLSLDPSQPSLEVANPSNPSTTAGPSLSTVDTNTAQVTPLVSLTLPGSVPDLPSAQPDSWELRLWTDLVWTANQAMGALVCCGPVYDQQALFGDPGELLSAERSIGMEKQSVPAAGYILRWIAGLLVARDPALCASPWLWHCPITDASLKYAPLSHSGSGGGLTFGTQPRLTFVGVDRRVDTLLRQLGEETLVLLLDINQASSGLLNWAVDQCFTATNVSLSTACFFSISRILENFPDFACDFVCLLILSFVFLDHPQKAISNRAFYLLRVIYHRFIIKPGALIHDRLHNREANLNSFGIEPDSSESPTSECSSQVCAEFSVNFQFWKSMSRWAPAEVVRQFAAQHPDLTLSVFSEITKRMESCREALRAPLLRLLIPWIINVELVDLIGDMSPSIQAVNGEAKKNVTPRVMSSGSCVRRLFTDEIVHTEEDAVTEGEMDDDEEEEEVEDPCEVGNQDGIILQESDFNRSSVIDRHSMDFRSSALKRVRPRPESLVVLGSAPSDADSEYEMASGIKSHPVPYMRTRKADSVPLTRPALNRLSRSSYNSGGYRNKSAVAPSRSGVCDQFWSTVPPTLRTSGWGSKQATELVLNNLFYLTLRLTECLTTTEVLRQLWVTLIRHRPPNLRVILRYLIVLTSVAPATLLAHSKRIITYLASEDAGSVVEELIIEMQTIDGIGLIVERIGYLPFFRITTAASVARANDGLETNPSNPTPTGTLAEKSTTEYEESSRIPTDPSIVDSSLHHQTLLQSVNPDEHLEQIDSELVAIGLERERLAVLKRKKVTHTRATAFPFGGSQRRSTIEVSTETKSHTPSRRPKSATCQPSTGSDVDNACPRRIIDDSSSSVPQTPDNTFLITSTDSTAPVSSNRTEPELDVDLFKSRPVNPEDKYGTLRAKDFSRLLSITDTRESEEASDLDPIPARNDYQARCGTLPMTADSRERYYTRTLPDAELRGSPGRCASQLEPSTQLPSSQQLHHSKRVKPKTRTHPRPVDSTKFVLQTVSLPPSLARLAPLPLSLPMGVPSLPSLWLSSATERTDSITSDSPQGATPVPRAINSQSGTRQSATVLQSKLSPITSQGSLPGKPPLQPLAMPPGGCYQAPLGSWLSEPLVIGGSVVYTGSWPASGARSPLVLILAGELTQSPTIRVDWNPYLPLMLLCTFLGIDHCRALVQEECKQLLVSLLSLICPEQESLGLLRLELEDCLVSCAYPSAFPGPRLPKYRLTVDGGPCKEKFNRLPLVHLPVSCNFSATGLTSVARTKKPERRIGGKQICDQSLSHGPAPNITLVSDSVLASIPNRYGSPPLTLFPSSYTQDVDKSGWNGSSYSLLSTDTLIPGQDDIGPSSRGPFDCVPRGKLKDESSHLQSAFPSKKIRLRPPKSIPPKPARHSFGPVLSSAPEADPFLFELQEPNKTNSKLLNESVEELRDVLISSAGQAVWTCEDYDVQRSRFYYSPLCCHGSIEREADAAGEINQRQLNDSSLGRLVRVVARILALTHSEPEDVEQCLQCSCSPLHGCSSTYRFRSHQLEAHDPSSNCVVARLSQAALNMGLSCANRHYANRSLQIFRILGAHLDRQSLSRLVARLGETVSDMNEELQGYVTELFYTLESAISHLQPKNELSLDHAFKRRANPSQTRTAPTSPRSAGRWPCTDPSQALVAVSDRRRTQRHSTSANLITVDTGGALGGFRSNVNANLPHAVSLCISNGVSIPVDSVTRHSFMSKAAVSNTKQAACLSTEEQSDLLCGIFLTGIFLLESDFEHEYMAGVRLLTTLIPRMLGEGTPCWGTAAASTAATTLSLFGRAEAILAQARLNPPFPGLLNLAIKGCSSPNLVDPACQLLVCLIPAISNPLVVPPNKTNLASQLSYPIMALTLLPMLLTAWDEDPSVNLNGLCPPVDGTTEQPSVLQGGFLGRGVCTATYAVPRALGSWASTAVALSPVRNASVTTGSSTRPNRLCRTDSVGFPGTYPTGVFGTLSHPGSIAPQSTVYGASIIPKLTTQTPLRPKNPVCIQAANALAQAASQIDSNRLANLELVLKQYASGSFSKDIDQWAKCVVCYMLEGYNRHASHLLRHLTTLLTIGPVCLQFSLLKVAHLFLEQVELNTPDLNDTLQQFITALSDQFLGTDFWVEITKIHQVLVSRSAVLNAPPPPSVHTLSGLDPSGSGRVLDFVAAAAAIAVPLPETEPPRLELAGPQLEFHFDLMHNAPLLAPHLALSELVGLSNQTGPDLNPSLEVDQQKTETRPPDSGLGDLFVTAVSSWNRSGACQVHLRERLYRLIESYGLPSNHRVGAPRSPSRTKPSMLSTSVHPRQVIFSQSTETLDPQLSVHSSSETASVIDVSNSDDIRLDETSSMEQAEVFRDLDTYLDAQLMNINFLGVPDGRLASTSASASEDEPRRPWGVRGQSITCHQEFQDDVLEQATDLLPTVRAPLFQASEHANCHIRWRSRHRSFPSVACEGATAESEPPEANDTIGRGWIDKVSVSNSLGESRLYTLTSSAVLSEGSSTHFASMRQHTGCESRALVPLHCDLNDISSSSSSLSPDALDFMPLDATDITIMANDTSPCAHTSAVLEHESGIPCLISDFRGNSNGNDMFHVSSCLMKGMELPQPHPPQYSDTSSRSPSHGSVFIVPSHHSPTSSLNLISTDEHEDRGLRKMNSSASLPQMLLLPPTFRACDSALPTTSQSRPTQIFNRTTVQLSAETEKPSEQVLIGKSTVVANASGLTENRNPTHRSLSTSNLLFKGEPIENGVKFYGPRGKPLRSPTKRFVTSGVLNRISTPLLKFHKTFTSKRQSCSAEDLLHLVKPKVSFIMPTKEAVCESPQNELHDQHIVSQPPRNKNPRGSAYPFRIESEGFDCSSQLTMLCGAQQSTLGDQPGVSSPTPDPDKLIPMSRDLLSYTWLDLHTLETDWLYDVRRAVDRSPVRARITCFTNLSNVFARLANRCYAAVQTTINLAGCSWDDANEFRQLESIARLIANGLRPPFVVYYLEQDMLLDSDQLAIGSPLSRLIELHNQVQAYLYQICQFITTHDAQSSVSILIRALIGLLKFLRIACTSSEDVCRYLELSVRPSVAQNELTHKLKCLMDRVLPLLPEYSTNRPHLSGSCGKCDWHPVLDDVFTQLLEVEATDPPLRPDVVDRLNRAVAVYRQRMIGFDATMANHRALVDRVTGILEWYLRQRWKTVPDPDVRLVHLILPAVDAPDGSTDVLGCCSQLCQQLNKLLNQFES